MWRSNETEQRYETAEQIGRTIRFRTTGWEQLGDATSHGYWHADRLVGALPRVLTVETDRVL